MENHCYNTITFKGKDLTKIRQMIADAIKTNETQGWLPQSSQENRDLSRYLFDVYVSDDLDDLITITCWTKSSPPLEELEFICKEAQVSGSCWYDECGCMLFGEFSYDVETDISNCIALTDEDFDRVVYDKENDVYLFDGKVVDSDYTAYQEMLDEKLSKL